MARDFPHIMGQRSKCLGRGETDISDTTGHVPRDTMVEVLDMSGRPFKRCYDRWNPAKPLPPDPNGEYKLRAFLDALANVLEGDRRDPKSVSRWMSGKEMQPRSAKACADVLIGADPSRAAERRQFIDRVERKFSGGSKPTIARPTPSKASEPRPPPRKMLFPRLFSFSVEIPSQPQTAHDPAAAVTLHVDMKHATEPVEGLSFHAEIALKRVVFTVDCDTCQPKINQDRLKAGHTAPRAPGVPANGVAFAAQGDSFNGQELVRELTELQPLAGHTAHTALVEAETDYDSLVPIVPGNGAPSKSKSVLGAFLKQAKFKRYDKLPLGKVEYPWGDAT